MRIRVDGGNRSLMKVAQFTFFPCFGCSKPTRLDMKPILSCGDVPSQQSRVVTADAPAQLMQAIGVSDTSCIAQIISNRRKTFRNGIGNGHEMKITESVIPSNAWRKRRESNPQSAVHARRYSKPVPAPIGSASVCGPQGRIRTDTDLVLKEVPPADWATQGKWRSGRESNSQDPLAGVATLATSCINQFCHRSR